MTESIIGANQCTAKTATGTRCKHRARYGRLCPRHDLIRRGEPVTDSAPERDFLNR